MRKPLLMAGALFALTATPAFSAGIELAWNACFGQPGAVGGMTSTCDSNAGSQSMFASFRPPAGINQLEGIEVFVDYQTQGASLYCPGSGPPSIALPCWWNFAVGQLRNNQLTTLYVSPTDVNGNPLVSCDHHYFRDNGAIGGGVMIVTGLDRGQLKGLAAIPAGTGLPVAADAQQYGIGFRISNGSTVPAGTCDGCASNVCFVVNTINLHQPGVPIVALQNPHPGSSNYVTWRPSITPTVQHTWGQIKSLYR